MSNRYKISGMEEIYTIIKGARHDVMKQSRERVF